MNGVDEVSGSRSWDRTRGFVIARNRIDCSVSNWLSGSSHVLFKSQGGLLQVGGVDVV